MSTRTTQLVMVVALASRRSKVLVHTYARREKKTRQRRKGGAGRRRKMQCHESPSALRGFALLENHKASKPSPTARISVPAPSTMANSLLVLPSQPTFKRENPSAFRTTSPGGVSAFRYLPPCAFLWHRCITYWQTGGGDARLWHRIVTGDLSAVISSR